MPRLVELGPIRWVGTSVRTRNADERDASTARIPALWEAFYDKVYGHAVPASTPYGIYSDYESDVDGPYTLTAGIRATESDARYAGLSEMQAGGGAYLVFDGAGQMPQLIYDLWGEVWDYFSSEAREHERAYAVDFEEYSSANEASIYVSVLR